MTIPHHDGSIYGLAIAATEKSTNHPHLAANIYMDIYKLDQREKREYFEMNRSTNEFEYGTLFHVIMLYTCFRLNGSLQETNNS